MLRGCDKMNTSIVFDAFLWSDEMIYEKVGRDFLDS